MIKILIYIDYQEELKHINKPTAQGKSFYIARDMGNVLFW